MRLRRRCDRTLVPGGGFLRCVGMIGDIVLIHMIHKCTCTRTCRESSSR